MEYANWEGADLVLVFVDRNGKNIKIQPLGKRSVQTAIRMSYDKPIGIIVKNQYSGKGGRQLTNPKYSVYYKGRNVETLGASDLDHPHIRMIEESLHRHDMRTEHSSYLPSVEYERGMDADDMLYPKRGLKKRMVAIKANKRKIDTKKLPRWGKPVKEPEFIKISGMSAKINTKMPKSIIVKEDEFEEKSGMEKIEEMTKRAKKIGGTGRLNF